MNGRMSDLERASHLYEMYDLTGDYRLLSEAIRLAWSAPATHATVKQEE